MRKLTKAQYYGLLAVVVLFLSGTSLFIFSQTPTDIEDVAKEFKLNCYAIPAECNCRADILREILTPKDFYQMVEEIKKTDNLDTLVFNGNLVNEKVSNAFIEAVTYCSN